MSGEDELERGYRRLLALYPAGHRLALYPAGHRRVHEQEILGVLMTGARAGQRRPGLAESADLIWGALRIRLRLGRYSAAGQGWGDALAVVSIVLPVFFLFYSASAALAIVSESPPMPKALAGYAATQLLARAALAALVLLGPRRIAALAAGALLVWYVATVAGAPNWSYLGPQVVVVILCLVLEIMALLASPGPRQGLRVMTWKHPRPRYRGCGGHGCRCVGDTPAVGGDRDHADRDHDRRHGTRFPAEQTRAGPARNPPLLLGRRLRGAAVAHHPARLRRVGVGRVVARNADMPARHGAAVPGYGSPAPLRPPPAAATRELIWDYCR
jgi:hypothetical protein